MLTFALLTQSIAPALAFGRAGNSATDAPHIVPDNQVDPTQLVNVTLLPLPSLVAFPQKPTAPPKPNPAPSQKPVTPTQRSIPRPGDPAKPTAPTTKADSSALVLLVAGADAHGKVTSILTTLEWRYLSKANLSLRPTSAQGQRALDAALRSAQGTLTLTRDGQARLDVGAPGKDTLPRASTLTDTKKLYAYRYDSDGKLAAITERALAPEGMEKALTQSVALSQTGARQVLAALTPPVTALLLGRDPLEDARSEGRLLSVELAGTATVAGVACTAVTATLREVGLQGPEDPADAKLPAHDKQRITFYLGSADKLLRQVVIENVLWGQQGSISILTFTNLKVNQPIPEGTFAFNPPAGVAVTKLPPLQPSFGMGGFGARSGFAGANGGRIPTPGAATNQLASAPAQPTTASTTNTSGNFGAVSVLDGRFLTRKFPFTNNRTIPITLSGIKGNCPCITGKLLTSSGTPSPSETITLPPGASATIEVTLDLAMLRPGPVHKSVMVNAAPAEGGVLPTTAAQYDMIGTLLPDIQTFPQVVQLGTVRYGQTPAPSVGITVRFDPRLGDATKLKAVSLAAPDASLLRITPVGDPEKSGDRLQRRYNITLAPNAPLGPILTQLEFVPPAGSPVSVQLAYKMSSVTAIGYHSGDLTAQPAVVALGLVSTPTTKTIELTAVRPELFENLTIKSDTPGVTARLLPAPASASANQIPQRQVEIAIAPASLPPSKEKLATYPFTAKIELKASNGQRFLVTVQGYAPEKK